MIIRLRLQQPLVYARDVRALGRPTNVTETSRSPAQVAAHLVRLALHEASRRTKRTAGRRGGGCETKRWGPHHRSRLCGHYG